MKKIACLCGKKGRVQHTRMKFLAEKYMPYLDVYSDDDRCDFSKYDIFYFSNARDRGIQGKFPKTCLTTITSEKNAKYVSTMATAHKFQGVSTNCQKWYNYYDDIVEYTPNGVDLNFWKKIYENVIYQEPIIGWVGNRDRKCKNYYTLLKPLRAQDHLGRFSCVVTSKHMKKLTMKRKQMLGFYNRLSLFLVTSSSEGTPNPALEAMACGVPVISTNVGNMPEFNCVKIVKESVEDFAEAIDDFFEAPHTTREEVLEEIKQWDWSIKYKAWDSFFRRYL